MPELPEVDILRRSLARKIINSKIIFFDVFDKKILRGNKELFQKKIKNSYFKYIKRYGGILIFKLASGYYLLINLYSKGDLIYTKEKIKDKNIKAVFKFKNNSEVYFVNSGQFGYIQIINDKQRQRMSIHFGLDPTREEFTLGTLKKIFRNKSTNIKNLLMNKNLLSGIGTIYADEICLAARVKPDRSVKFLKQSEVKRIYVAIRKIFKKSILHGGIKGGYNKFICVHDREGKKCLKCKQGIVKKILVSNRRTFFCPICQK
jgi:formamidopyrimidine-DNA glycosylase